MKAHVPSLVLGTLLFLAPVRAQTNSSAQFRALQVDAAKVTGAIRSFQGVNGPPYPVAEGLPNLVRQYRDLRIDLVRTHDSYGPTEVDAHYHYDDPGMKWLFPDSERRASVAKAAEANLIFPDWSADPEKPASYNFGPSDELVRAIRDSGADVYFRIGRSAGGNRNAPLDLDKFTEVVKHVAMHYNLGWADGFRDQVRYWEFWNEPEFFWSGTPEQFFRLYEKTARALKSVDASSKLGSDALALTNTPGPYREGFLDFCAAHQLPLDFYSWHTYADFSYDPYDAVRLAEEIRSLLDAKGFRGSESILSEWNLSADFTAAEAAELGSILNGAFVGAVLIYMQDAPVDRALFYRGDPLWMGLFGVRGDYLKPAYAFKATGLMLSTPERLSVSGADTLGLAALAGRSRNGKTVQVLISNYEIPAHGHQMQIPPDVMQQMQSEGGTDFSKIKPLPKRTGIQYQSNRGYKLSINHLPWGAGSFTVKRYRLTETQDFGLVEQASGSGSQFELAHELPPPGLELIVLESH